MPKVGEFIYPWGGGHYARMMRFDDALAGLGGAAGMEVHYSSKGRIYQRLLERFPDGDPGRVHQILMPTPIDGRRGPSLTKSLANLLLPVGQNPPLVRQIACYLREEGRLYDAQKFDLVVNDGDMGSNVLAERRKVPSLFITNQFRPKLYRSRSYLYPAALFISKQIAKATKILVADSPPPHTVCEYNLNFPSEMAAGGGKVEYVGYFAGGGARGARGGRAGGDQTGGGGAGRVGERASDLGRLLKAEDAEFGYWMRTGDKSTNDGTGRRYAEAFAMDEMASERRLVSHARNDPGIDAVTGRDGRRYTISEAADRGVDWIQIDIGFLTEPEKEVVLGLCSYAVVNGSHTVLGEIMGIKSKPIIGVPIYDEHANNIRWADEHGLGIMATNARRMVDGIRRIRQGRAEYTDRLAEFSRNFDGGGAQKAAKIASEILQEGEG